jgi:hypothetical protein
MISKGKQTTIDTSLLQRMFWDAWELAAGRPRTLTDIHDPQIKQSLTDFTTKYLPEIRRIRNGASKEQP